MLMIGWTTVETREQANTLAHDLVSQRLAACVQVDGPITSHYLWQSNLHESAEFRLCIKFLASREQEVTAWVLAHHAYETPEWITVRAENVSEKYLSWVEANFSN